MAQITWIHLRGEAGVRAQGAPPLGLPHSGWHHHYAPLRPAWPWQPAALAPPGPAPPAPPPRPPGEALTTHLPSVVICRAPPRRLQRQHSCGNQTAVVRGWGCHRPALGPGPSSALSPRISRSASGSTPSQPGEDTQAGEATGPRSPGAVEGEAGSHPRGPHRPRWLPEHRPAAGASYRGPGVGRAAGTRPALIDQLGADAVATCKTVGAASVARVHVAGDGAFWSWAAAFRAIALPARFPESRPLRTAG